MCARNCSWLSKPRSRSGADEVLVDFVHIICNNNSMHRQERPCALVKHVEEVLPLLCCRSMAITGERSPVVLLFRPAMSRPSQSASTLPGFPQAAAQESRDGVDELIGPLKRLRMMGYGPANAGDAFVGGFARPPASSSSVSSPGRDKPLPPPPPPMDMPRPSHYPAASVNALYPIPPLPEPPRMFLPPLRPVLAVEALLAQPAPPSGPWRPFTHSAPPPTAVAPARVTPQRRRSSSTATAAGLVLPSSNIPAPGSSAPPSPGDANQCSATTKAGKRCGNKVKAGLPLTYIDGAPEEIERYCHIHLKEALQPTGFYSRKQKSVWVDFDTWIPDWLSPETKAALRSEMEKAASSSDADGYIYTFELRRTSRTSLLGSVLTYR